MEFSFIISACREDGGEQEVIDLLPGDQYILPYRPISSLVHSGAAKLIWPYNLPIHTPPSTAISPQDITPGQPALSYSSLGVYRLDTVYILIWFDPKLKVTKSHQPSWVTPTFYDSPGFSSFLCVPPFPPPPLSFSLSLPPSLSH